MRPLTAARSYALGVVVVVVAMLMVAAWLAPDWTAAGKLAVSAALVGFAGVVVGTILWP